MRCLLPKEQVLILLCLGVIYFSVAKLGFVTADSNLYIDIGKRLIQGQAQCGFDMYQTSVQPYFPSLPLVLPIWPMVAGVAFLIGKLQLVAIVNVLFIIASALLFYKIASYYLEKKLALLVTLLVYISQPILTIVLYPWTEGIGLFFLHLYILSLLRHNLIVSAALTALMFLVRIQYTIPMLIIGTILYPKRKFLTISLLVPIGYEILCLCLYHKPYPSLYLTTSPFFLGSQSPQPIHIYIKDILSSLRQLIIGPIQILFIASLIVSFSHWKRLQPKIRTLILIAFILFTTYPILWSIIIIKGAIKNALAS